MATDWVGPMILAFVVAVVAGPFLRILALRSGFVDRPADRKIHTESVPYLGGVAIMLGALAAILAGPTPALETVTVGVAAVSLGVVGLLDDRLVLRAAPRIVVQITAAVAVIAAGVQVDLVGVMAVDAAITLVWLVALTNAMNLADNVDGLAGGLAVAIGAGALGLGAFAQQSVVGAVAAALVGATLGFLVWNLSARRIFMGDAGALFLGFALAVLIVEVSPLGGRWAGVVVAALLVGVPALDVGTVMAGRFLHGVSIARAGKDHLSHRLVRRGLSARQAAATLVLAQAVLSVAAVAVGRHVLPALGGVGVASAVLSILAAATWRVPVYLRDRQPGRARVLRRLVAPIGAGVLVLLAAALAAPGRSVPPDVLVGGTAGAATDAGFGLMIGAVVISTAWFTLLPALARARSGTQSRS